MKPYQFKAESPQSGNAWKNIASDLCEVKEIAFRVNQKSVRDRYRLLSEKNIRRKGGPRKDPVGQIPMKLN